MNKVNYLFNCIFNENYVVTTFFLIKLFILYWSMTDQIFPGSSVVKNLPAVRETQVQSLSLEDSQEKEMATRSSILA